MATETFLSSPSCPSSSSSSSSSSLSSSSTSTKKKKKKKKTKSLKYPVDQSQGQINNYSSMSALPQRIPKIIWITFEQDSVRELPKRMRENVEAWQKLNPDYSLIYLGEKDRRKYIQKEGYRFPGIERAYEEAISGAAKADLIRALLLYVEGGIYIDIDLTPIRPIHDIISPQDEGLSHEIGFPSQNCMAYTKFHPFLRKLLKFAVQAYREGKRGAHSTAGPLAYQRIGKDLYQNISEQMKTDRVKSGTYISKDKLYSIRVLSEREKFAGGGYQGYLQDLESLGIQHWTNIEKEKRYTLANYFMTVPIKDKTKKTIEYVQECSRALQNELRKENIEIENIEARGTKDEVICQMTQTTDVEVSSPRMFSIPYKGPSS